MHIYGMVIFTSEDSDGQQKAHGVEISFFRRAYNTGISQALQFINQIFCWFYLSYNSFCPKAGIFIRMTRQGL